MQTGLSVCLSFPPSSCPSVCLSVFPSVVMSVCLSVFPSVVMSVCLSLRRYVRLSVCLSHRRYVRLSVCLSFLPSVCPSVCLSVFLSLDCSIQNKMTYKLQNKITSTSQACFFHRFWIPQVASRQREWRILYRLHSSNQCQMSWNRCIVIVSISCHKLWVYNTLLLFLLRR